MIIILRESKSLSLFIFQKQQKEPTVWALRTTLIEAVPGLFIYLNLHNWIWCIFLVDVLVSLLKAQLIQFS